ncbi:MAG: DUF4386 domain-containing protein [Anaerolineales bacterium]|nr:DUF4386 domain-containing protein [Anaerolineales bacterium]
MTAYKSSIQMTARIAAILTLLIVVLAPFSMLYIPTTLIVPDDAAMTANNIMASQGLFRAGMVSDSIVFLIEIVLTVLLYVLVKPVDKTLSLAAAFSRLAMTVIQGINLLNHFIVLLLLSGASYLTVFAPDQLQALVLLFLNAHESVTLIWGLFFGLHLLIFSYLVYKSVYLPKFLGIILFVVALCYFIQDFGTMLLPQYKTLFISIGSLAFLEIVFPLWFLVKGVNIEQWEKRIAESA